MDVLRVQRFVCWIERITLFFAIAFIGIHAWPNAWSTLNTDFPNYYLTARLAHEHYDTARAYEWVWIQRQKDYTPNDNRHIGLIPITPFSTLIMWPISTLPTLAAKHVWLLVNLALLVPLCWLLR